MPIDEIPEEQSNDPNQPPEPAFHEEVVEANIRLDPRDLQIIIQAVKSEPAQASQPCSSKAHTFKREGFARQHEFNSSVIRKLYPLLDFQGVGTVIDEVIHDLEVRNETLVIADSHPQVFEFLDVKEKSESLKATDPRLSEFMESIKKKEQEASRKRKAPPPQQPFRKREAAWHTASLYARRMPFDNDPPMWHEPSGSRRPFSYAGLQSSPYRRAGEYKNFYKEYDSRRKSTCKNCGREGHWYKECPDRR